MPGDSAGLDVAIWAGRHTHHWDDWSLTDLVAAKSDRRVSLVVPARNECEVAVAAAMAAEGDVDVSRTGRCHSSIVIGHS